MGWFSNRRPFCGGHAVFGGFDRTFASDVERKKPLRGGCASIKRVTKGQSAKKGSFRQSLTFGYGQACCQQCDRSKRIAL